MQVCSWVTGTSQKWIHDLGWCEDTSHYGGTNGIQKPLHRSQVGNITSGGILMSDKAERWQG